MKTIPFDYDKYISTFPRPKVFTKGGIEVLDFHRQGDKEVWKLWGKLVTGPTVYCSFIGEDKDFEGWTNTGQFTVDGSSDEMKAFNEGGKYDLVMSDGSPEKVVYAPGLTFKIYNVYHDPARNTVFLDGGFLTPGEALENKGRYGHIYLGMFSLQDNPQFNNIFLDNGLAKIV